MTKPRTVIVIGPNLPDQSKGQFHVHAADCADLRNTRKYRPADVQQGWTLEAATQFDVAADIYCDIAHDNEGEEGWSFEAEIRRCMPEIHFLPCCGLKDDAPEPEDDPRVAAIRADKIVGRGTCTTIDEATTDAELAQDLDDAGIGPKSTVRAIRWARAVERTRRAYADDIQGA